MADQERTIQNPAARYEYDVAAGGWFFSKELGGGGHLTILGCHYLDLLRHIGGSDFKSVSAFCRNVGGSAITVEDAAVVNLEFANGMVGNLNSGYYTSSAEYGSARHNGIIFWGARRLAALQPERRVQPRTDAVGLLSRAFRPAHRSRAGRSTAQAPRTIPTDS